MTRVLSTEAARGSVEKMRAIINNGLADQIGQLAAEGRNLSQPDVWDGSLASQFRAEWEARESMLRNVNNDLEQLRVSIEQINANIMLAGGNA